MRERERERAPGIQNQKLTDTPSHGIIYKGDDTRGPHYTQHPSAGERRSNKKTKKKQNDQEDIIP